MIEYRKHPKGNLFDQRPLAYLTCKLSSMTVSFAFFFLHGKYWTVQDVTCTTCRWYPSNDTDIVHDNFEYNVVSFYRNADDVVDDVLHLYRIIIHSRISPWGTITPKILYKVDRTSVFRQAGKRNKEKTSIRVIRFFFNTH